MLSYRGKALVSNQDGTHHPAGLGIGDGQWNVLTVESIETTASVPRPTTHNPSMALIDNVGNATGVTLTIYGDFPGWSGNTADFDREEALHYSPTLGHRAAAAAVVPMRDTACCGISTRGVPRGMGDYRGPPFFKIYRDNCIKDI